jgi:short-subunit dehydrogenase
VAGDRGRASNATYGAAKAGVSAWASGQRARLSKSGVQVVTLKPGTVDSPMTAHLKKGPLFASARKVGRGVVKAMDRRKDTAYLPGYWKLIMLGVIHMPEFIFKKLKF